MLKEAEIIDAVCGYLEQQGFKIISRVYGNRKGHDIVAESNSGGRLIIEAKGEGSSLPKNIDFAHFDAWQVNDHVGRALLRVMKLRGAGENVGMAFPDNPDHRREVGPMKPLLRQLGIRVYFVSAALKVKEEVS